MKSILKHNDFIRLLGISMFCLSTFTNPAFSQNEDCDCPDVFNQLVEKLEANYIGLKHFQANGKGPAYEDHKNRFTSEAKKVKGADCAAFLQSFLDFFEDGHVYVIERPQYEGEKLDSVVSKLNTDKKSVASLRQLLASQKAAGDDPLIGNYKYHTSEFILIKEGELYRLYITASDNAQAIVGSVKAEFKPLNGKLRGTYYSYAGVPRFLKGGLYKEKMMLRIESAILIKMDTEFERELGAVNFENTDWPTVQKLDEDNVLVTIPRFSVDKKVWDKVTTDNRDLIQNARNLIIDIRGNRGGNAIYFSLFNLFADSEMPGGQGHVLASADNLAYFKRNMQWSKKIYKPVVDAIEQNMGEIVDGPLYPKRNYKRKKSSKIQNVAILTDEACMSAAESFIMHSKQNSSLVKTFGSPTDGVIDYTSVNAVLLKSGRQNIYFGYPTSTLHKRIPEGGYNQTGMLPDVPIESSVADKIGFIMDYYKKGN